MATEEEHAEFKSGMVRLLSNFVAFDVKRQYLADPEKFRGASIHDSDTEDEGAAPTQDTNPWN